MDPKFLEQPSLLRTGAPSKVDLYPSSMPRSKPTPISGPSRFPGPALVGHASSKKASEAGPPGDDPASFKVGDRVEHFRFGAGRIEVLEGRFPDTKATIIFERHGTKQILLKFARLTKILG